MSEPKVGVVMFDAATDAASVLAPLSWPVDNR